MGFGAIPGQEQIKAQLQTAIATDSLSHAYIFEGPSGTGRKAMAQALAQAIYCAAGEQDACGHCAECRKIAHGNHPDVIQVHAEGASVKIGQIRELQQRFAHRASTSKPRIYTIEEAERLTPQAANALLKFLEEPESPTLAILITENGRALLPTVRSRSQKLTFLPLAADVMQAALLEEGLPAALVRPAVRLASGLAAARELIQLNWFAETRNAVLQLAKESLRGFPASLVQANSLISKGEIADHLDTLFDLFALWCRDVLLIQNRQTESCVYTDQLESLERQARTKPARHWVTVMDEALQAKRRLRGHANPQLVLERFLGALQGGV